MPLIDLKPDHPTHDDHDHHDRTRDDHSCTTVPELQRLQYFFGQMLGVADFRSEQAYFREKLKLHNRCFHGYGTVCGLKVRPVPRPENCPTDKLHPCVRVECGIAI